jgi:hypothetical protein
VKPWALLRRLRECGLTILLTCLWCYAEILRPLPRADEFGVSVSKVFPL